VSTAVEVCPLAEQDRAWANDLIADQWGGLKMVTRGILYDMTTLPGLIAWRGPERVGLLMYRIGGDEIEVMSLDSLMEGIGIGSALLAAVQIVARSARCRRLWLITTNDNLHALRFYQRRGFRLAALYPNALAVSRQIKPQIPLIGLDEIPLRDEIELELFLDTP
jgi:ribosomal protein S18 acetylase RimI-like enzyme